MIIALDVDGVLADILTPLKRLSGLPPEHVITQFDCPEIPDQAWRDLDVFMDVEAYRGAHRLVQALRGRGHRVIAVTRPPKPYKCWGRERWMEDRARWLRYELNFDWTDIYHCQDKSLVQADYLLDDTVEHVDGRQGGVLFQRPYNAWREYGGVSVGSFSEFLGLIGRQG